MTRMFGILKSLFAKKERIIHAIVILDNSPRFLDRTLIDSLCKSLELNAEVREVGVSSYSLLIDGFTIEVFSYDYPYPPFKGETFTDTRMDIAVRDHVGFTVVECKGCPTKSKPMDSVGLQARIAAQLSDDYSIAIYDHNFESYAMLIPAVKEKLSEGDLDMALRSYIDVVKVRRDEEMEAAMGEARRRWPEFCDMFANKTRDTRYSVKVAFFDEDLVEHMWVNPTSVSLNGLCGKVANDPASLARPRFGDEVQCTVNDISDWMIQVSPKEPFIGKFTSEIVMAARTQKQK